MKEGKTAQFELELSHENIPVTWYKNDVKIHPSRTVLIHVDGKKHVLEIKEVTLDDTCQIKAEAKGIPSMANLTVIGKPRRTTCLFMSHSLLFVCVSLQMDLVLRDWFFMLCVYVARLFHTSVCLVSCVRCVCSHIKMSLFQREMHTSQ